MLTELPSLIGDQAGNVVVIHSAGLPGLAAPVCQALAQAGYAVRPEPVPDGEAAKDIASRPGCGRGLPRPASGRTDAIVGVGGGAVTDLAGFVAATWLRGVRVVLVPTTLLGMTDAAIGGKTAINTADGKNLVGAFYPPAGVLADLVRAGEPARGRVRQRAGRGDQGRVHRRPGDPRPDRGRPGRARRSRAARTSAS